MPQQKPVQDRAHHPWRVWASDQSARRTRLSRMVGEDSVNELGTGMSAMECDDGLKRKLSIDGQIEGELKSSGDCYLYYKA